MNRTRNPLRKRHSQVDMGSFDSRMSGQFFVFGFEGTFPPSGFLDLIERRNPGGVILFSKNIESPRQISEILKELKSRSTHPLFAMIDQEGGRVNRITKDFPVFPSNEFYGNRGDEDGVFKAYKTTAAELGRLGINVNLAPVVDVLTNPHNSVLKERSFGKDPALVARMSQLAVEAIQSEGVLACAKHFPGIGGVDVDPHSDLPVNSNSKGRFERIDFVPFKASISSEISMIMSTHVLCPNLDSKEPASLSKVICTDILRKELGFEGVLITDDMQMGAIRKKRELIEACKQAFLAGNDLILVCDGFEEQVQLLECFEKQVADRKISEERLNSSLNRILSAQERIE